MNKIIIKILVLICIAVFLMGFKPKKPPQVKSKFYDFSEQMINGEIRKPTIIYTDIRQKVRFERLLSLKKSFLPKMYNTASYPTFK